MEWSFINVSFDLVIFLLGLVISLSIYIWRQQKRAQAKEAIYNLLPLQDTLGEVKDCQQACLAGREACIELFAAFTKHPWQLCEKFADCPAVREKNKHITQIEQLIERQGTAFSAMLARILEELATTLGQVQENRKALASFTEDLGKQLLRIVAIQAELRMEATQRESDNDHKAK